MAGQVLGIRELGRLSYEPVWHAMQRFTNERDASTPDELWLLEHPPVFTQGQAGKPEHLLLPGDIPVVKVDRGGQVTYHGPGQLVVYLLLDVRRLGLGVRELVSRIERSLVEVLASYAVDAYPKADAPGVYVGDAKIASLGLRIRNGRSFHGLALNLDMDLQPFARINPCGYAGLRMTQLRDETAGSVNFNEVGRRLSDQLARHLDYAGHRPLAGGIECHEQC
ncbi:lipoyl(octanoyl) transferase LipB [Pseudomonas mangrovi]|uniref:Octanoyltransferase n=1 Tax=Pseudomonas mangrovi TaxID=2161748 RepID=A0A2T5P8M1_9PSED|nr:lipoyl(octanoyl) transferase LipB [Pseudomonas mangrovi]PTU74084.1 octanoyltransferase [Pseudomonas mangrovi]